MRLPQDCEEGIADEEAEMATLPDSNHAAIRSDAGATCNSVRTPPHHAENNSSQRGNERAKLLADRDTGPPSQPAEYSQPPKITSPHFGGFAAQSGVLYGVRTAVHYIAALLVAVPVVGVLVALVLIVVPLRCVFYAVTRWTLHGVRRWLVQDNCDPLWPLNSPLPSTSLPQSEAPLTISHCVITVQGALQPDEVRTLVWKNVLSATHRAGGYLRFAPFTQRLVDDCLGLHSWLECPQFDIQQHVGYVTASASSPAAGSCTIALPVDEEPAVSPILSLKNLESYLNELSHRPHTSSKQPPWEIRIVPEFGDNRCTLLIVRVHALLAEHLCVTRMLQFMNDLRSPVVAEPRLNYLLVPSAWSLGQALVLGPLDVLLALVRRTSVNGAGVWQHLRNSILFKSPPSLVRRPYTLTWARVPDIDHLLRLERLMHCSLVELYLAFIAGAFQRHFREHGIKHPPDFDISLPVTIRADGPAGRSAAAVGVGGPISECCSTALISFRLPVSTEGSVPRVWEVQRRLSDALEGPRPFTAWLGAATLNLLAPKSWTKRFFRRVHAQSSCVAAFYRAGADFKLAGHKVHSMLLYNSTPFDQIGVSFSFVQVGREAVLSLAVDPALFPDPDSILLKFQMEIQRLVRQTAGRLIMPLTAALLPIASIASPIFANVGQFAANAAASPSSICVDGDIASVTNGASGDVSVSATLRLQQQRKSSAAAAALQLLEKRASSSLSLDSVSTATNSDTSSLELDDLEQLLETVQVELNTMRENPSGNLEDYYARLTLFEQRMENLQTILTQKLVRQASADVPPRPHGTGGRALSVPSTSSTAARVATPSPIDRGRPRGVASTPPTLAAALDVLLTGDGGDATTTQAAKQPSNGGAIAAAFANPYRAKRRRSRRTSSPTAVRAQILSHIP